MSRRNRRGSFGLSSLMPTVVTTPSRRQPIWAVRAVRSSRCIMSNMARKRRDVESGAHTPPSALGRRSPRLPVVELSRDGMVSCTICRWSTPCHATSPISRSHFDNGDAKGTESLLTLRWRKMDWNYQYAGTVNVDDHGFARDIIRVAAAMAASTRLARTVRVRTTQPSRRPHLVRADTTAGRNFRPSGERGARISNNWQASLSRITANWADARLRP